jgi:hypothetical protein
VLGTEQGFGPAIPAAQIPFTRSGTGRAMSLLPAHLRHSHLGKSITRADDLATLASAVQEFMPAIERLGASCCSATQHEILTPAQAERALRIIRGGKLARLIREQTKLSIKLSDELAAFAAALTPKL